mmetsp:Transcript_11361/g.29532  ORF Transcript_11361/g.29532 Transcript_11361/m.29532 type:complete len:412 (-) Transcript_11361:127-1362(-)
MDRQKTPCSREMRTLSWPCVRAPRALRTWRLLFVLPVCFAELEHYEPCNRPADAVVITGHGRSGSTLTERMFDQNPAAFSSFEPVRPWDLLHCFSHAQRSAAICSTAVAILNCDLSARVPMHCRWHNGLKLQPLSALTPELVESELVSKVGPHRQKKADEYRQWSIQLQRITASLPRCRRVLGTCGDAVVAIKVVRATGLLNLLASTFQQAEARRLANARLAGIGEVARRRLAILHVIRDPRALLHSRYKVGWLIPHSTRPRDVRLWAKKTCSPTLQDMKAGDAINEHARMAAAQGQPGRSDMYMRIRYEDLVANPIAQTRRVYSALGRPVPAEVEGYFRDKVKHAPRPGRSLEQGFEDVYSTNRTRSADEIMLAWRKALSPDIVRTVERQPLCQELMRLLSYEPVSSQGD